ncbi:FAD NAD(P)-binding domain-containing protein [Fusarium mundagurra]|uniref:FAD NAD(P)-binding domain-containing protein n=1 Tax=Fusarium mundagurra TaxID=1567541 RepID=A0A8H6D243_9HYPO|nr:FAD NAD(P)-binding domain-containing protein [Fusarium mundagurra]
MASEDQPIHFLVIGAGFGGLACAIELQRKGCKVHVFEKESTLSEAGDVIILAANGTIVIEKWPAVFEDLRKTSSMLEALTIQDSDGKLLLNQPWEATYNGHLNIWTSRAQLQKVMYAEAVRLGVEFTFGAKVTEHWEDGDKAGVFVNGEKLEADAVIGADGVYSRTRQYITKVPDAPKRSGFAIYRSWFSMDRLLDDPLTRHLVSPGKDSSFVWIGPNQHAIVNFNTSLRRVGAFVTHKDTYTMEESWSYPGMVKDMLACVEGWDPVLRAVFAKIPEDVLVDFKLLWRDPVKKWVSDHGRVVIIGDACHPHLPTSASGAAQALEDAASLGAVVDKAGKANLRTALKVFEKLRFERTTATQRMGWETRHKWHQSDWDAIAKNPEYLKLPQPEWLYGADSEAYAYENYDRVVEHLEKGAPFKNTNLPPGYEFDDWTIDQMMELDNRTGNENLYVVS